MGVCPGCGRCRECGRRSTPYQTYPYVYPYGYPYVSPWPNYPQPYVGDPMPGQVGAITITNYGADTSDVQSIASDVDWAMKSSVLA